MPHSTNPARVPERWAGLDLDAELPPDRLHLAYLVVQGNSSAQIAATLNISEDTVKQRMGRVLRATGAASRTQLVVWMYEAGHVTPPPPLPQRSATELRVAAAREQILRVRADLDVLTRLLETAPGAERPTG